MLTAHLYTGGSAPVCGGYTVCDYSGNDAGIRDTLAFEITKQPNASAGDSTVEVRLYVNNDSGIKATTMGFKWTGANAVLDSAAFAPGLSSSFDLNMYAYEDNNRATSNGNARALFSGYSLFSGLTSSGGARQLLATYWFTLNNWFVSDSIVFDTLKFDAGSTYKTVGPSGAYYPVWAGPIVIHDVNYSPIDVEVVQPSLGEMLTPGHSYLIGWTNRAGFSDNVTIEYSINGGTTFALVASDIPNTNTYSWTVPNEPSSSCRIRIRQAGADAPGIPQDTSDNFSIFGLRVLRPNGGETWFPDEVDTIQWMGPVPTTVAYIDLFLSRDGGSNWDYIGRPDIRPEGVEYASGGQPTDQALIRVQSIDDSTISDQSDSLFTIAGVDVTSPAGGEIWQANSMQLIQWTSYSLRSNVVRIELSIDSGRTYPYLVADSLVGVAEYFWTVPMVSSSTCFIRVIELLPGPTLGLWNRSRTPFTITP